MLSTNCAHILMHKRMILTVKHDNLDGETTRKPLTTWAPSAGTRPGCRRARTVSMACKDIGMTDDVSEPAIPWAEVPDQTIIYDMDSHRELLRMRGFVPLPIGAVVQLGVGSDPDNPPQDGIVRVVRLWGAVPGGRPVLRMDVDITLPA
jgi:hypothetical protein